MPCNPPIAFCRTVGHASFHTARAIGPSTIDRSKRRDCVVPGVATDVPAGAPGVNSVDDPAPASAADDAVDGAGVALFTASSSGRV
jgi:hypothetical protein